MANKPFMVARPSTGAARTIAGVAVLAASLALVACGSGSTTTVSVQGHTAQPATPSTGSGPLRQTVKPVSPRTGASGTSTQSKEGSGGGTAAPGRTASGPAFTRQGGTGEGVSAALEVLKDHGFTAVDPAEYHSSQTLRVLVGIRSEPGAGNVQQAFFFEGGRYLGTDTSQPSASVDVVGQNDTEVTLAYSLYRPHDPRCCPGGGRVSVRFELNNGSLQALDPIPPVSSTSASSRQ